MPGRGGGDDAATPVAAADLALLACPDDGDSPLTVASPSALACRRCRRLFPVEDGIPRLLPLGFERARTAGAPVADEALRLKLADAHTRDLEAERYDEIYRDEEYRHELSTYVRLLAPAPDHLVLDVGAGTGRVVKEYAGRCRRVVALDFSHRSLGRLLGRADLDPDRVLAVEGDGTSAPFRAAAFDRVAALSVLCFLRGEEQRQRFLASLHRCLKPDGRLVISTYHWAPVKRLWALLGRSEGALREGHHSGGTIWYRNETRAEFGRSLDRRFEVEELVGVCHRVPLLSNLAVPVSRRLDGLLGRLPSLSPWFATEIVARCRRR